MSDAAFVLHFTPEADETRLELKKSKAHAVTYKKVLKTLKLISRDPRYPGLHTHKYRTVKGDDGSEVWQSYVENKTPGAWRIWWQYGPESGEITILSLMPHP